MYSAKDYGVRMKGPKGYLLNRKPGIITWLGGVYISATSWMDNDGEIRSTGPHPAIKLYGADAFEPVGIDNGGKVVGKIAVRSKQAAVDLANQGAIRGLADLGSGDDTVQNSGRIVGKVKLGAGADVFDGAGGIVEGAVMGGTGRDILAGGGNDDRLDGGRGDDTLVGGKAADRLAGGPGSDTFRFDVRDSKPASPDIILDFADGDRIDLSAIDAIKGKDGDQAFDFIGGKGFSATAGELRYGADGRLKADLDGDGRADFIVVVVGAPPLDRGDFSL